MYQSFIPLHPFNPIVFSQSFPDKIDFGISLCGEEKKSSVHIFNFGNSQINYVLKSSHSAFYEGNIDVTLFPASGTLEPSGSQEITVTLNTNMIGFNVFCITYEIRRSLESDLVINKISDKVIMTVMFTGVFPSLSVEDIKIENGGPVFNKSLLWKLLNINK